MDYKHGGDIYTHKGVTDFSANITPFGTCQRVLSAATEALEKSSHYPDASCRELVGALSEYLKLKEEKIAIGNGAADIIFSTVLAVQPKKALVMAPAFGEYEQALHAVNCEVRKYYLKEENMFRLDGDFINVLEQEIAQGVEMLFLCSPDNPTGMVIEKQLLEKILVLCEEQGVYLLLDESFWQFAYESVTETMQQETDTFKYLVLIRSFTKMYGIAGLRLGYGIYGDRNLKEKTEAVRQPWSVSTPAQMAGIAALKESNLAAKTKQYIDVEREYLKAELEKLGIICFPSRANYLLLKSKTHLYEKLLERGILIRNCDTYSGLEDKEYYYFRIAVRKHEENEMLLRELEEIVRK